MVPDLFSPLPYGFHDFSAEDYFKTLALNSSSLKLGESSPYHIDCSVRNIKECDSSGNIIEQEDKKHFVIGGAYHTLVFEPKEFSSRYLIFDRSKMPVPDSTMNKKENKEWKKAIEQEAESAGLTLLDSNDYDLLQRMRDGLLRRTSVRNIIEAPGKLEHTMLWQHPEYQINCKGKIDKLLSNAIIDIKTATRCSKKEFSYAWNGYNYALQAAFYQEGYKALTGKDIQVVYILQEKTFPYYAKDYPIDQKRLDKAKQEYYPYIEEYISYLKGEYDDSFSEVF